MTILVGVVDSSAVAVLADRSAVVMGTDIGHGVPEFAADVMKVFSNGCGLVAGVAGLAERDGVDVLAAVREAVLGASSPHVAEQQVYDFLTVNAQRLAGVAGPVAGASGSEVVVAVLIGGWDESGPVLRFVTLDAAERADSGTSPGGRVFVSAALQGDADAYLARDAGLSVGEQVTQWGARLPSLGVQSVVRTRTPLTTDYDYAVTTSAIASSVVAVEAPGQVLGVPRH